ncbi:MAG: cbb3-type cytochrome c oxidase subunit I [Actinomycetota bacterium]|nr:MAG: Cbb3-type cytochrome oxidase subunit [Actinomycetota bacterium]MDO8950629.1 cbb3-type cytochrome c oxidase subunit I [Actinomycetota bacterium]MDP3629513.1 cbb3-type cytochrome c oxidase subunit I [Actinomycetota bacterium]
MHDKGDTAVRTWLATTLAWFPLFTTIGFLLAIKFLSPTFLTDTAWLTFGRLRPAHVNGVAFGLLSSGLIGVMLYVLPRVVDAPLRFPRLATWTAVAWNVAVLTGIVMILGGGSQGREYAELPWIIDVAVELCLLALAVVVFSTIRHRREKKLYVSAWYYSATMLWFPVVYFVGNVMWHPATGALNGTIDGIFNWYYGHNILGLWFTTLAVPAWYFFIPKIVKRPLYSHMLSLIGFFSIAFFYTGVGEHHLLQAPIPAWLRTEAVIMSALMAVPVLTFAVNILLTTRGVRMPYKDTTFRFIMAGFFMYIGVSLQGSFQALRTTNAYLHFSQYPVAHAHLALTGAMGFTVVGLALRLVPLVCKRELWNRKLLDITWWVAITGFITFFTGMTLAGLVANAAWWNQIQVVPTLPLLPVHFFIRAVGGGMVVTAAYLFGFNLFMTMLPFGAAAHPIATGEPLEAKRTDRKASAFQSRSQQELSLPIILVGGISLFSLMTFMVVGMPYMFAPTEASPRAVKLNALEQKGMDEYRRNGCFYCHSQFVRTQDWAVGTPSEAGDFFYSVPNFLGTERTGPTIGQIGGKRPTMWIRDHYLDPRKVSPTSVMPNFKFLADTNLTALSAYIETLGGKDLEPRAFQPIPPEQYASAENPYNPLMKTVAASYEASSQTYSGSASDGKAYAEVFEAGKIAYIERCLSCHGCSGNGQGPYARTVVTRPANLNERLKNYPSDGMHFWRISEGVPGTAMPPWRMSMTEDLRWRIATYEDSMVSGAIRTVEGGVSDDAAIAYANRTNAKPSIAGTKSEWDAGKKIYDLYCAQCHGEKGDGQGPAAGVVPGGYILPKPAVFSETGHDFKLFGQYQWKLEEGVPTTNMPPWKYALSKPELANTLFYIQTFAEQPDYAAKWGPLYRDPYARNFGR